MIGSLPWWARAALVVGLHIARAHAIIGRWFGRRADQLGARALAFADRVSAKRQQRQREPETYDQHETPDKRHPTRCPSCGMLEIEGHALNCDRM